MSEDFVIQLPVDLSQVEEWQARAGIQLPPGRYDGVITRITQKDADAGKLLLVIYQIKGGEFDGIETMPDQITLADKITDPEKQKKALGKYKQWLKALSGGKAGDHGQQMRSGSIKNKPLSFEVFNETYEGTLRNKFRNYMAYDAENPSPGKIPGSTAPVDGGSKSSPASEPAGGQDIVEF